MGEADNISKSSPVLMGVGIGLAGLIERQNLKNFAENLTKLDESKKQTSEDPNTCSTRGIPIVFSVWAEGEPGNASKIGNAPYERFTDVAETFVVGYR
jgi:hypothetical protein